MDGSPAHVSAVKDYAAFTAGKINPNTGRPQLVDDSNDEVLLNDFGGKQYPWWGACKLSLFDKTWIERAHGFK